MPQLNLEISRTLKDRLRAFCDDYQDREGVPMTMSHVVREALDAYLTQEEAKNGNTQNTSQA